MSIPTAEKLLSLWQTNAKAWTDAVRSGQIDSRKLCTDAAVVDAVVRYHPRRVLDVGCGEGWLTRALVARGINTCGVDPVAALVDAARAAGAAGGLAASAEFQVASLADLNTAPAPAWATGFDLWVSNFSLFHEQDAPALLAAAACCLPAGARLVVQTLHRNATVEAASGQAEVDAWQPGSWGSCGAGFGDPIAWYYRTEATWRAILARHGFVDARLDQPQHPNTGRELSYLITARTAG